jgi:hypothetical protein
MRWHPKTSYIVVWTYSLDRKAALFSHLKSRWQDLFDQLVMSEGHEENEGSVNEFDARSCKTKAE